MWEVRIQHEGLRAFRVLKGPTRTDAQWKATAQLLLWEQRWTAQRHAELALEKRLSRQMLALHGRSIAAGLTRDAAQRILALDCLLATSLERGVFLHWNLLKDHAAFSEPPIRHDPLRTPAPQLLSEFYAARISLLDKILWLRRKRKRLEAGDHFHHELARWRAACSAQNLRSALEVKERRAQREQKRSQHHEAQLKQHAKVDECRRDFELHEENAVEYFFSELLSRSNYPSGFPEDITLQYIRPGKTLIVEYELPPFAAWPTHRQVRYIAARNVLQPVPAPDAWLKRSYENALYQIALRVLHELFTHDDALALDRIAFNGRVRSVDKATGNMVHACVLSVLVARDTFTAINLAQVDPRSCFRNLKGIASSNFNDLLPIRPLLSRTGELNHFQQNSSDPDAFEDTSDHASAHRSDFDNLIGEIFEREFHKNRSQVRLSQSGYDSAV